jgi:hypothetical protein
MKWKSLVAQLFLAVLFYSYPLQKDEVTNLSKIMSSGRPFTIDSSALVEPKTDRATTRALVF